jgi:hypothetical protein
VPSYKPGDLFVSAVSLFSVVLPGAAVSILAWHGTTIDAAVGAATRPLGTVGGWIAFIIIAYLVGKFLYAVGSWILDPVFDRTYLRYMEAVKGDPRRLVRSAMDAKLGDLPKPNPLPWARALLRIRSSAASADIDQIEADSKFFRSFTLVFVAAPLLLWRLNGSLLLITTIIAVTLAIAGALLDQWADFRDRDPNLTHSASRPSWLLNGHAVLSGGSISSYLLVAAWDVTQHLGWAESILYVLLVVVTFVRFAQQRWRRNETTYESAAILLAYDTDDSLAAQSRADGMATVGAPPSARPPTST